MNLVTLDMTRVTDWSSFHALFADTLGFPVEADKADASYHDGILTIRTAFRD